MLQNTSTAPTTAAPPPGMAQALQVHGRKLSVLMLSSQADGLARVAAALRRDGLQVQIANTAGAAHQLLRQDAGIGVILTDVMLLNDDTFALASSVLTGTVGDPAVELVLVTGYAAAEGCAATSPRQHLGHLHRSLSPQEITALVRQALARADERRGIPAPHAVPMARPGPRYAAGNPLKT